MRYKINKIKYDDLFQKQIEFKEQFDTFLELVERHSIMLNFTIQNNIITSAYIDNDIRSVIEFVISEIEFLLLEMTEANLFLNGVIIDNDYEQCMITGTKIGEELQVDYGERRIVGRVW